MPLLLFGSGIMMSHIELGANNACSNAFGPVCPSIRPFVSLSVKAHGRIV